MRLCKGDFVEVLRKKEVPTGSWHCAEVICGNGHTYTVKYVLFRATSEGDEALTERVPRKVLRPCPPPVVVADNWVPGDHVEVFHNMSWKTATVMKYLDQHMYLVRLLGDSREFEVHRSYLRVRQSWEDGKWFTIGKGGCAMSMKKNCTNTKTQLSVSKARKRASPVSLTNLEEDTSYSQKTGVTETGRSQKRLKRSLSEHLSPLSGKVDNYIYPHENLGGSFVHTLLDVGKNNLSVTNLDMIESNQFNHALTRASRSCGTNSGASSVGSCSINDTFFGYEPVKDDLENLCSDAESFGGWGNDGSCRVEKNVELYEHRLNLLLYRSALRSLYASGPLSWEDEMKMVDLRDALQISNDEHLVEIKNLISTDTRITAS